MPSIGSVRDAAAEAFSDIFDYWASKFCQCKRLAEDAASKAMRCDRIAAVCEHGRVELDDEELKILEMGR